VQQDPNAGGALLRRRWYSSRAAIFVSLFVLTVAATAQNAFPAAGQPGGTCAQWDVSGTWQTEQGNGYHPVFVFQQSDMQVTGTAMLSGAEQARAGYTGPGGPVAGTLVGDRIDVSVTWTRRDGPLRGQYTGTIVDGRIVNGMAGPVTWTGAGPATCARFAPVQPTDTPASSPAESDSPDCPSASPPLQIQSLQSGSCADALARLREEFRRDEKEEEVSLLGPLLLGALVQDLSNRVGTPVDQLNVRAVAGCIEVLAQQSRGGADLNYPELLDALVTCYVVVQYPDSPPAPPPT
jgi:hypothetical protein